MGIGYYRVPFATTNTPHPPVTFARNLRDAHRDTVHAPGLGIVCMIAGGAIVTCSDGVIKALPESLPTGELLFGRGLFALALIAGLVFWRGGGWRALRVESVPGQAIRAFLMTASSFLFVFSLRHMPLAEATVLLFVAPILITAMAALFLRETVEIHRWSAVAVGFAGVVLVVRPDAGALNWAAIFALLAAFAAAVRDVLTRRLAAGESSIAILFYTTLGTTVAGGLTLPFEFRALVGREIALLAASGTMVVFAHFLLIEAYRYAEAAATAPYKYLQLVVAAVLGYAFWDEVPDAWTVAGSALIVAGGLYIARREALHARSTRPADG